MEALKQGSTVVMQFGSLFANCLLRCKRLKSAAVAVDMLQASCAYQVQHQARFCKNAAVNQQQAAQAALAAAGNMHMVHMLFRNHFVQVTLLLFACLLDRPGVCAADSRAAKINQHSGVQMLHLTAQAARASAHRHDCAGMQ
jgi:hypothetical protein